MAAHCHRIGKYFEATTYLAHDVPSIRRIQNEALHLLVDQRAVHVCQHKGNLPLRRHLTSVTLAQSSGLHARPSRDNNSSAAAGPLPPAA